MRLVAILQNAQLISSGDVNIVYDAYNGRMRLAGAYIDFHTLVNVILDG